MLFERLRGRRDRDELDLVKLVLADHAARVAPGGAGLGAKAIGAGGEAQRELRFVENEPAGEIGERHFGGRDEPIVCCVFVRGRAAGRTTCRHGELILAKLRQLRRAEHRGVAHEQRWRDLRIAVLVGVQIEHELRERAFEPRELALIDDEARAGKF